MCGGKKPSFIFIMLIINFMLCHAMMYFQVHTYLLYVMLCHVMIYFQYMSRTLYVMPCYIISHTYMSRHVMPCQMSQDHLFHVTHIEYVTKNSTFKLAESFMFIMPPTIRMGHYPSGTPLFTLEYLNWCEIS
jgi:hypothetical protein